jgi:CDP-glycerol glycerophosphotransferase (TagB/SpsB family)
MTDYNDVMSSDFHLVFGEGVAEQYQDAARRFDTRLIAVGSAALERIARSSLSPRCTVEGPSQRGRKKVVYVTTNYWASNSYITYFPPPSDNKHWLAQKAIIDVLGKHEEHSVIVKLHPNLLYREPPLRSYVKERGFRNIEFVRREYSFPALLASADVIVGDFASTTMLQTLVTSKPILVYLGIHHLDEQPMELLRRRAVCEADLEAFTGKLDQHLSCEKSVGIELTNRDFAERYGNMSGEGSAGERAAKALRKILEASAISSCADRMDPRSSNGADIKRRGVEIP